MELNSSDVWGHFAPMFHLVDAFAMYAITLVGGRHAILPTFSAHSALLTIGICVTVLSITHLRCTTIQLAKNLLFCEQLHAGIQQIASKAELSTNTQLNPAMLVLH